jgi:hypothetical protein
MKSKINGGLLLFLLLISGWLPAQVRFLRNIEKKDNSDTIKLTYEIRAYRVGEIARVQQKIPNGFKVLSHLQKADTAYFVKDVVTTLWTSLPSDTMVRFVVIVAPSPSTLGYVYLGECAFFYGGKMGPPQKKYLPKEKVWLVDSLLIPSQDTVLYAKIDSINTVKTTPRGSKNLRKTSKPVRSSPYSFRIQITATKIKQKLSDLYRNVLPPDQLFEEQIDDYYKYTIGPFSTYKEAKERLIKYQQHKINGYIVAFKNGNRIPIKEASVEEENEIITQ